MSPMFPSYVLCPMSMFSSVITNKVFMCHQHAYTPQITHCLTHTVSHHSSRVPLGSSRHLWWRPFRGSKGHYLFLVKHVVVLHACLVFLVPLHHLLQVPPSSSPSPRPSSRRSHATSAPPSPPTPSPRALRHRALRHRALRHRPGRLQVELPPTSAPASPLHAPRTSPPPSILSRSLFCSANSIAVQIRTLYFRVGSLLPP